MKRMLLAYVSIVVAVTVVADGSLTQPASAQNLICVEAPAGFAPTSARRKATRSDCNFRTARTKAINAARANALAALRGTCIDDLRFAAQRQAVCEPHGLGGFNGPFQPMSTQVRAREGGGDIDGSLQINSRLCVVLRDLPDEFSSSSEPDGICFPFVGGKRTIFTARSRARCGVLCL